jgi:hypothetical protein
VNEPIKIEASKDAELITKVRVNINVEEDRGVRKDGGFYEKRVSAEQIRDDKNTTHDTGTTDYTAKKQTPPSPKLPDGNDPFGSEPGNEHKTRTLKNMIDNQHQLIIVIIVLVVIALGVGLVALFA